MVVIACLLVAATLAAICYLTHQDPTRSGDAALAAEKWLLAHVRPTGTGDVGEPTWAGLTIRKLAHIAEYGALGLVVGVAVLSFHPHPGPYSWATGIGIAAIVSLLDQVAKHFVPGRHFDAADLPLDATGYVSAVTIANVAWALLCL